MWLCFLFVDSWFGCDSVCSGSSGMRRRFCLVVAPLNEEKAPICMGWNGSVLAPLVWGEVLILFWLLWYEEKFWLLWYEEKFWFDVAPLKRRRLSVEWGDVAPLKRRRLPVEWGDVAPLDEEKAPSWVGWISFVWAPLVRGEGLTQCAAYVNPFM